MLTVVVNGRITKDPEIKKVGDVSCCEFSLAYTNYKYETSFINCVAWDTIADNINKYCKKGSQLFITGFLKTNKSKEGNSFTSLVVNRIEFGMTPKIEQEQKKEV